MDRIENSRNTLARTMLREYQSDVVTYNGAACFTGRFSSLFSLSTTTNAMDLYTLLSVLDTEHCSCDSVECKCSSADKTMAITGVRAPDAQPPSLSDVSNIEPGSDGWSEMSTFQSISSTYPHSVPASPSPVPSPVDFIVLDSSLDDAVGDISAVLLQYAHSFPPSTVAHELREALQNIYYVLERVEGLARWIETAKGPEWDEAQIVHNAWTVFLAEHVDVKPDHESGSAE
ncbi:hypothetical protein IW262DRAFT_1294283 [Armillaria fumosa]|nr:hypothetical protein IW262DRAFT_1294283 [Armillaria fumosa]